VKVLVDAPVWSLFLRRKLQHLNPEERRTLDELKRLVRRNEALFVGPVRQEVLSGVSDLSVYERIRDDARGFTDEPLRTEDFEEAARASNVCRAVGIAGSNVDFLLCAVAVRRDLSIFTTDGDFEHYARHLPLRLHAPRGPR
jgi:predicted nucleic acid-binding protein